MRRHGLTPSYAAGTPLADVTATICGAHAQVLSAGEVSLALRVAGATRADVRHVLWEERSLVKTFGPRGTVHLLPARDLSLWTGALSALPGNPSQFPEATLRCLMRRLGSWSWLTPTRNSSSPRFRPLSPS